jgi:hypothetical protein
MLNDESDECYEIVKEKHHKIANILCAAALTLQLTPKVEKFEQEDLDQLSEQIEIAIVQLRLCQEAFGKLTEKASNY